MFVASSVTYICQGGILLLSHSYDLHQLRDLVIFMASSVTYIRQGGILLLSHSYDLHSFKGSCHFYGFVSNLHLLRRNLIT